jgi:hypothetical protein
MRAEVAMTPHRFIPRSLAIDEEERPAIWDCPCGASRQDPTPRLTDNCHRIELLEPESA